MPSSEDTSVSAACRMKQKQEAPWGMLQNVVEEMRELAWVLVLRGRVAVGGWAGCG